MQLSKHFTIEEFEHSQTAMRLGIDNRMPIDLFGKAEALCSLVLERVRHEFGPVVVSSGYRCKELNHAIGSGDHSQHILGEAADIVIPDVPPIDVCRWIEANVNEFDQLIQEGDWTHVSYREGKNRRQVLTAHFEKDQPTRYTEGL